MGKLVKLLTNESFIGVAALGVLGGIALFKSMPEMAAIALGGIAAMLKGEKGEKDD